MREQRTKQQALYLEATIFGEYLVGQTPPSAAADLYVRAVSGRKTKPTKHEQRLLAFMAKHPWSVAAIDGGLNIVNRTSEVRSRIYTMFSILEARPEFHDQFLSKDRAHWYIIPILFTGAWGLLTSLFGIVLVKVVIR
ncbi:MAG TPA: hypothetical protein VD735_01745 [Candidatus Saccharimonadales bacterium]|nr:hypothetical protein [Candidatus Saccharimonadales bacterium]